MKRLEELVQELPPELQQEVYDFARFLLETKAKPRRKVADFIHWETYDRSKLRRESQITSWPKS